MPYTVTQHAGEIEISEVSYGGHSTKSKALLGYIRGLRRENNRLREEIRNNSRLSRKAQLMRKEER